MLSIVPMKMTGLQLVLVAILSSPVIVAEDLKMEGFQLVLVAMLAPLTTVAEFLDPVEFLISKNYPRNKTLIPLPKNFDKFGDEKNDCCALKLFIEVKDLDMDGTGKDDGESDNESQTETGFVTFIFKHPEIRKSDVKFIMTVEKDKAKVKSKHLLDFDNCTNIIDKTFNIYATTTITDDKDVRVVLVNGKDVKIGCDPIPDPDPKEIKASQVYMYVYIMIGVFIGVFIGWLLGITCGNYSKIKEKYQKYQKSKKNNQESRAEHAELQQLEAPGASAPRDKTEKHLPRTKDDVSTKSRDSGSDSSDEERGGEVNEKFSRNKKRGGNKNITPMVKDKEVEKCSWSTKICKNKPLFFTIVCTCVWIVISVIITGIMVPPLLTENS